MNQRVFQPSFAGGIIGSDMYARSDTTKYAVGVKSADNVFVRLQGGLSNRPGFRNASGFDTSSGASTQWLMSVQITESLSYHVEFSDGFFTVISEGAYVLDSNVTPATLASISEADPMQIVANSAGEAAVFSVDDLVYLDDPNGDHALDQQVFKVTGVASATISLVCYDGTTVDTSAGAATWGTIGSGATLSKVYQGTHSYAIADVPFLRYAQDNADIYIVHPGYAPSKLTITAADDWALTAITFEPTTQPPAALAAATINAATQTNPVVITTAAAHGLSDGSTIYVDSVGGMTELNQRYFTVVAESTTTLELYSAGGSAIDGTGYTAYTTGGTATTSTGIEATAQSGTTYRWRISALDGDSLEESLPGDIIELDSDLALTDVTLIWPAVENATIYNIYKEAEGGYGLVGTTANTSFVDNNIDPDTTFGPKQTRNPFENGNNPSVVGFAEQRLALAATVNDPQVVEMSQTGTFTNFTRGYPVQAADALTFRLRTGQLNTVRSLVSGTALLMFTGAAEWLVTGNQQEGVLTPTSIVPRPLSYWGSYDLEPLKVGEYVFFLEPSGSVIRDFRLAPSDNVNQNSRDLTIMVRDLFEGLEVTSWCYAKAPHSLIWVTLSDGSLLSICYMAEHDLWGWTTHTLGGTDAVVYQVSCAREGAEDAVYAVVGRTLENGHCIMTERLDTRVDAVIEDAFYLDAGLSYSGTEASVFSGLFHLRGQTVSVLADGAVFTDLTVNEAGAIDLGDDVGTVVHAGLPYTATIETLDVDFEADGLGSMQGRYKAASEVAVMVKSTRGISAGTDEDRMQELIEWEPAFVGAPIPAFTGTRVLNVDGDWVRNATVIVKQTYPLPMTVLGIAPEWALGE